MGQSNGIRRVLLARAEDQYCESDAHARRRLLLQRAQPAVVDETPVDSIRWEWEDL